MSFSFNLAWCWSSFQMVFLTLELEASSWNVCLLGMLTVWSCKIPCSAAIRRLYILKGLKEAHCNACFTKSSLTRVLLEIVWGCGLIYLFQNAPKAFLKTDQQFRARCLAVTVSVLLAWLMCFTDIGVQPYSDAVMRFCLYNVKNISFCVLWWEIPHCQSPLLILYRCLKFSTLDWTKACSEASKMPQIAFRMRGPQTSLKCHLISIRIWFITLII